jgi:hypothetical protein
MDAPVKIILGSQYDPTMWDLRKRVAAARKAHEPLVFLTIGAPIVSPSIGVAIESGSLYLAGVQTAKGDWFEVAPENATGARPRLPKSRWIMTGAGQALFGYGALRLEWNVSDKANATGEIIYGEDASELLRFFERWDGQAGTHPARRHLWVLIFMICEALRFRSILSACAQWINQRGPLIIDKEMLSKVRKWRKQAEALKTDSDIWTWPPKFPDQIIS